MKKKTIVMFSSFLAIMLICCGLMIRKGMTETSDESTMPTVRMTQAASILQTTGSSQSATRAGVTTPVPKKEKKKWKDAQGLCYRPMRDEDGNEVYGKWEVYAGKLKSSKIVIPDTFRGEKVVQVSNHGFADCKKLISVTFGKNIRILDEYCFQGATNLSEVKFKSKVSVRFRTSAFERCSSLKQIHLPNGKVRFIGSVFKDSGLESIVIPDNQIFLFGFTFSGCRNLKKVTMGKNIQEIDSGCFKGCVSLEEIVLPKKLRVIEEDAFKDCTRLQKVTFRGDVYGMSEEAFAGTPFERERRWKGDYYVLGGVILETYQKHKGDLTITDKTVINGQRIRGIGGTAYSNCKELGKVVIKNIRGIGSRAFGKSKAKSLYFENMDAIDCQAFKNMNTTKLRAERVRNIILWSHIKRVEEIYVNHIEEWNVIPSLKNTKKIVIQNSEDKDFPGVNCAKKLRKMEVTGKISYVWSGFVEKCNSLQTLTIDSSREIEWGWLRSDVEDNIWFKDCTKLKDVYLKTSKVNETVKGVFPDGITLHVPESQIEEYRKYVTCNVVAW